jgi:site-specific recombinase XerD
MNNESAKIDVHDYDGRVEAAIRRIKADDCILPSNKEAILSYVPELVAKGLTAPRVAKYLTNLPNIAIWLGVDFKESTRDDITRVLNELLKRQYSAWTVQGYKVILKKFYQWLFHCEDKEYPQQVKHVKTSLKYKDRKMPEELWTEEEVKKLVAAAKHPRDKALIMSLYESGCRVGEISSVRIKHLNFDAYGAVLIVDGKTGMRRLRLVSSVPALAAWLECHPDRANPDAPLWVGIGTRNMSMPLTYPCITKVIEKAAHATGIRKKYNPHIFRHSRATFLAKFMTEAKLKYWMGWDQSSNMAAIYVHLSGRDIDDTILEMHGVKQPEQEKGSMLKPVDCSRCRTTNMAGAHFCNRCAAPLDMQTALSIEEKTNNLAQSFAEALGRGAGITDIARRPDGLNQEDLEKLAQLVVGYMKR